jgi:hypothetical protein
MEKTPFTICMQDALRKSQLDKKIKQSLEQYLDTETFARLDEEYTPDMPIGSIAVSQYRILDDQGRTMAFVRYDEKFNITIDTYGSDWSMKAFGIRKNIENLVEEWGKSVEVQNYFDMEKIPPPNSREWKETVRKNNRLHETISNTLEEVLGDDNLKVYDQNNTRTDLPIFKHQYEITDNEGNLVAFVRYDNDFNVSIDVYDKKFQEKADTLIRNVEKATEGWNTTTRKRKFKNHYPIGLLENEDRREFEYNGKKVFLYNGKGMDVEIKNDQLVMKQLGHAGLGRHGMKRDKDGNYHIHIIGPQEGEFYSQVVTDVKVPLKEEFRTQYRNLPALKVA